MNPFDQATAGNDIVDLRDVRDERERILRLLEDAGDESFDAVVEKKISVDRWADDLLENNDLMMVVDLSNDDVTFVIDTVNLEGQLSGWGSLDEAANNNPVLVLDDHFVDYIKEMASDLGAYKADNPWPLNCIDWEAAADELRPDWNEVKFAQYVYQMRG